MAQGPRILTAVLQAASTVALRKWQAEFIGSALVLEKEMATHSSVLAWTIPWTEEPGGLPSMGSHRVGHD